MLPVCVVNTPVRTHGTRVQHTEDAIEARYSCDTVAVVSTATNGYGEGSLVATPVAREYIIKTSKKIPKCGLLLVGLGGNNGSTLLAGVLANKMGLSWETTNGTQSANWLGSLFLSGTMKLGHDSKTGQEVYVPITETVPLIRPDNLLVHGWDISSMKLGDAAKRAKVLDVSLQSQLYPLLQKYTPMKGVYLPDFMAANQADRADNTLQGTLQNQLDEVRRQIRTFKLENSLDKVIVLWTATTERRVDVVEGVNDTAKNLLKAIKEGHHEIAGSTIYAAASILEGCSYINGSPQNTFVPGMLELAVQYNVFVGGDDFKTGQTKLKSVLVDFLVGAGIKPKSIVSYNHLGNNDGKNLSSPLQFRSKEISKSNVVDDMVESNQIMFRPNERPDHSVVIRYVPHVGDSKRALDEYCSEIFLGGSNTLIIHNTCEDSLLAVPVIMDLVILTEFVERVAIFTEEGVEEKLHTVLSLLSYFCKAPLSPEESPLINSLFSQRECILNFFRACVGLPPNDYVMLPYKLSHVRPLGASEVKAVVKGRH